LHTLLGYWFYQCLLLHVLWHIGQHSGLMRMPLRHCDFCNALEATFCPMALKILTNLHYIALHYFVVNALAIRSLFIAVLKVYESVWHDT